MRQILKVGLAALAVALLLPISAYAQTGAIAGQVKDSNGGALQGVLVEVASPQLIEKVRATNTDSNGRYQIAALPVGSYQVTFTLDGFSVVKRENVVITSDFTAPVNADLKVGAVSTSVNVVAEAPIVNVNNVGVTQVFQGTDIADLPTQRDIPSVLNLVPSLVSSGTRGVCSGGVGLFCNATVPTFNSHIDGTPPPGVDSGIGAGRIMVDGMVINMGRAGSGINENVGIANGIVLDTAAAQEVSFTLSGSLGESETGGASINLVPRTGGNRYAGSFFTSYTQTRFFDRNRDSRLTWAPNNPNPQVANQAFVYDYDVTGNFGGPVLKDRLWFYLSARNQGREWYPGGGTEPGFLNLNSGKWGANYLPDRETGWLTYRNVYRNASARITAQATPKNKFNVYWDEQDSCTNPCYGMISLINSVESYFTLQSRPNRLMQLSWTNPFTNQILFEAGVSVIPTHQDTTRHREYANPRTIPRICESGTTVGRDDFAIQVNTQVTTTVGTTGACDVFSTMVSGSLNDAFPGLLPATVINDDTYRSRASASYITGSHNAKIGFDGAYFSEKIRNEANDLRLNYHYQTPVTAGLAWNATTRTGNCLSPGADAFSCGNMNMYYGTLNPDGTANPNPDPGNRIYFRPKPVGYSYNTGVAETDETVWFGAIYLQDQWTLNRFTLNGAVRWDHSESSYGQTCIGPDIYVPSGPIISQAPQTPGLVLAGAQPGGSWCSTPAHGVTYNDITPRWGVAWDVFGNGKTAVKWNMGKYVSGAGLGGLYTNFNDARRSTNQLTRGWDDINGNRIVECDDTNYLAHTSVQGDFCAALTQNVAGVTQPSNGFVQFGRAPTDAALQAFAAANSSCGIPRMAPSHALYCGEDFQGLDAAGNVVTFPGAGQNLMSGWGKRNYNWQFGLGVQHELLPRLSVEVTYNRRVYGNLTDQDTLNSGCDYYGAQAAVVDWRSCPTAWMGYNDPTGIRDFYSFTTPADPRLPNGGGYRIRGLTNNKAIGASSATTNFATRFPDGTTVPATGTVTLVRPELGYSWNGVDTNFVLRARGGLRISGGTSTGRANRDTCLIDADNPNVVGRVGNEFGNGCRINRPFQTNVRANASYTIPWVDVLVGTVFQYRPGSERAANMTVNAAWVQWEGDANCQVGTGAPQWCRAGGPFSGGGAAGTPTASIDLLDNGDKYGEGLRLTDLNFSKNIRFGRRRVNFGVNVYNVFNSDGATTYQDNYAVFQNPDGSYTDDNPATANVEVNDWGRVTGVTSPRFVRFTVQFDF